MRDTIFALASGAGRAAVAVIRISGPDAGSGLIKLCGGLPPARRATLRAVRSPVDGDVLDQALVLWLPGPNSFTGEDQTELQVHGGPAVVDAVFEALLACGFRPAEPGEFTRRAFESGRLDLAEAEGVADLVDAETAAQRRQALIMMSGSVSGRVEQWRRQLVAALALLEAGIDFADEALPGGLVEQAMRPLEELRTDLIVALGDKRGPQVRDGFRVALIGRPNAGKSSLFNALVGRDAAIVTPIAGTTRDVIEAAVSLDGFRVIYADTAGLRDAAELIEAEGVRRAERWAATADLRLWVVDAADLSSADEIDVMDLMGPGDAVVVNKIDLPSRIDLKPVMAWRAAKGCSILSASAVGGHVFEVEAFVRAQVVGRLGGGGPIVATRERHFELIQLAIKHLDDALMCVSGPELIAEDVRLAARALERLSGRVSSEDVLDRVFAAFCIGK